MGFRTVVILDNDHSSDWGNDPLLGSKISEAASHFNRYRDSSVTSDFLTGCVVEVSHTAEQSLMIVDGLAINIVASTYWYHGQVEDQKQLTLLKIMAAKLGYNVSKKRVSK